MSKKDQIKSEKDRILVALNREDRYMSPNEIAQSTRLNQKPHVIRDRLKDLLEEGKVTRQGIARGTKYKLVKTHSAAIRTTLPTPTVKARGEVSFPLSQSAKKVRDYVTAPLSNRANVGYTRDFLDEYHPNTSSYLTEEDKDALLRIGQVEGQMQSL